MMATTEGFQNLSMMEVTMSHFLMIKQGQSATEIGLSL